MLPIEAYPINEFIKYLSYQKRYSPNTIIAYQTDLKAFFAFVIESYAFTPLTEISPSMVRTWLASLKEMNESSKTINRKISSLKSFFKYQLRTETIQSSPVAAIHSLKISRKLPAYIEQSETEELFEKVDFSETWEGRLDYLILEILYQTGIRLSELIYLKESNIDTSNGTLKVEGKGSKERLIPISNRLIKHLVNYLEEKRKKFGTEQNEYLLVNAKGNLLYPKYIYNMSKKYLRLVSTIERKSPHTLRHTFATHLTNNGAQINAIKELLGHSSLAATQIYTHNSIEKLKEVHKQAHPRS
ncbi:MAG: tyrosine-type recombinase/integrase [Ginsengibacter sp.]